MLRRILVSAAVSVSLLLGFDAAAQNGTFSSYAPYSAFGVGDLNNLGNAYNKSMGGVGIAARNHKYINPLNPASITARDSLSVMADVSLFYTHKLFEQDGNYDIRDLFNIGSFAVTLPIYKSLTFVIGLNPFSNLGYSYATIEDRNEIIGRLGNVAYTNYGQGSIYQLYGGLAASFWDRLSVGAQYLFYFGSFEKEYSQTFSIETYSGMTDSRITRMNASSAKFGLQYEQPIGKDFTICLGGTYRLKADMNGNFQYNLYSGGSSAGIIDTEDIDLKTTNPRVNIASELGAGLSVNYADKLTFEFDYTRSDWTGSAFDKNKSFSLVTIDGTEFTPSVAQSMRAGIEWTPNRNDVRYYFKRATYRFGAYYNKEYYKVAGNDINSMGITFGATLPIFRWYNGCTIAVDLGKRGSVKNNLILERYATISLGVNLYDIWFRKPKYD